MADKRNPLIVPPSTDSSVKEERNPLYIPDPTLRQKPKCPGCQQSNYGGRRIMGVIHFTCNVCGMKWEGGLAHEPVAPGQVLPPESYVPPTRYFPDTKGEMQEIRRSVDTRPDFRKGALIPDEGDE